LFGSEEYGKMGAHEGISGAVNRMGRPNLLLMLAMVGHALPDLCYCLVYPAGWGWEEGGWN
jgi:hypothetical protein